jgi:hypothetical protein
VSSEVAEFVFARDRICFGFRRDPAHVCRNQWGDVHAPDDRNWLTLDHVHRESERVPYGSGTMGDRAKSDARHLTPACSALNVGVPSAIIRAAERDYLTEVAP